METVNIETITPELAREYLRLNKSNRRISNTNVEFIANEIETGKFCLNGQSIVFDADGNLVDGQHRLSAVLLCGIAVKSVVVRNAETKAFKTIDSGRSRNASDVLSVDNIKYQNIIASATKRILDKFGNSFRIKGRSKIKISNGEIYDFYVNNKEELDSIANFCTQLYNTEIKVISPSITTGLYFLLSRKNKEKIESFIREIYTGSKEGEDISAQTLHKKLLNAKLCKRSYSDKELSGYFISAFRGYCNNKNLKKIVISSEKFEEED